MLSNNVLYVVYLYGDRWYAQWMAHKELKVDKTNEALKNGGAYFNPSPILVFP